MANRSDTTSDDTSGMLPMGATADGRTAVLNFATGAVALRGSENPGNRLLHHRDFDTAMVGSIFRGAGYEVTVTPKGRLMVEDVGVSTIVYVGTSLPMLRMRRYYDFRKDASQAERHQCVNTINEAIDTGRAYCDDDGDLALEAELHLGAGLSPAQLLAGFRFFSLEVLGALSLADVSDMLAE
jgi:hypothetical protein